MCNLGNFRLNLNYFQDMKLNEETRSFNAIHCQEFPLLKVPYETLNRKFRLGQRIIESESRGISQVSE